MGPKPLQVRRTPFGFVTLLFARRSSCHGRHFDVLLPMHADVVTELLHSCKFTALVVTTLALTPALTRSLQARSY
jgi:hypothetical protein